MWMLGLKRGATLHYGDVCDCHSLSCLDKTTYRSGFTMQKYMGGQGGGRGGYLSRITPIFVSYHASRKNKIKCLLQVSYYHLI